MRLGRQKKVFFARSVAAAGGVEEPRVGGRRRRRRIARHKTFAAASPLWLESGLDGVGGFTVYSCHQGSAKMPNDNLYLGKVDIFVVSQRVYKCLVHFFPGGNPAPRPLPRGGFGVGATLMMPQKRE